jgi:hypothetical protein
LIYVLKITTVLQLYPSHLFVGIYLEKNGIRGMRMLIMSLTILVDGVEHFLDLDLDKGLD